MSADPLLLPDHQPLPEGLLRQFTDQLLTSYQEHEGRHNLLATRALAKDAAFREAAQAGTEHGRTVSEDRLSDLASDLFGVYHLSRDAGDTLAAAQQLVFRTAVALDRRATAGCTQPANVSPPAGGTQRQPAPSPGQPTSMAFARWAIDNDIIRVPHLPGQPGGWFEIVGHNITRRYGPDRTDPVRLRTVQLEVVHDGPDRVPLVVSPPGPDTPRTLTLPADTPVDRLDLHRDRLELPAVPPRRPAAVIPAGMRRPVRPPLPPPGPRHHR
jgi:hypothetical protein